MTVSYQQLARYELLRGLPQDQLVQLSRDASVIEFSKRELVISGDERIFPLGFLLEGRLQGIDFTVDGRGVGLYYVEPGDFFGEQAVIDSKPLNEQVIAVSKSKVTWLGPRAAQDLILNNPTIGRSMMKRLSGRVRAAHAQRTLLALPNPFQKLCAQILLFSKPRGSNDGVVSPIPTHQELALMINVSRETVTRAFQQLIAAGVLERQGSELRLLRIDYLSAIAKGASPPTKPNDQKQ